MSIIDRVFEVAYSTLSLAPQDGLAHPFGFDQHEPHQWRVSRDVWDALRAYCGDWVPEDPPADARLLGEPIAIDKSLPPDSIRLDAMSAVGTAVVLSPNPTEPAP